MIVLGIKLLNQLLDMNRSLTSKELFSTISQKFDDKAKQGLIDDYYVPYRKQLELSIFMALQRAYVMHISIHSFAPRLNNETRNNDIGLLYDPKYKHEKEFADMWKKAINAHDDAINVRFNYPYKGSEDGVTSYLRKMFQTERYYAIDVEINQKHLKKQEGIDIMSQLLIQSLKDILAS